PPASARKRQRSSPTPPDGCSRPATTAGKSSGRGVTHGRAETTPSPPARKPGPESIRAHECLEHASVYPLSMIKRPKRLADHTRQPRAPECACHSPETPAPAEPLD